MSHAKDKDRAKTKAKTAAKAKDRLGRGATETMLALIDAALPALVRQPADAARHFRRWEALGVHVTPVDYYSPIPDLGALGDAPWREPYDLAGVDMNEAGQLARLADLAGFAEEYAAIPRERPAEGLGFFLDNPMIGGTDALALYGMLRLLRPERAIEVGSGYSSRLALQALRRNGRGSLLCIEPYPTEPGRHDLFGAPQPGLELLAEPVQEVDLAVFERLRAGDALFIDSSHVARIGGDVPFLFLRVLPRLAPGVVVHVHDIFLPREYRREWVEERLRFWNEQYLLHAFLLFNGAWEVLLANSWLAERHPAALRRAFPTAPWWGGGSFWMRRTGAAADGDGGG